MSTRNWLQQREDSIRLFIKVKAHARSDAVGGIVCTGPQERLEISIRAIREKGKANEAIIAFLSHALGIAKSDICIIKGTTLPLKEVAIYNASYSRLLSLIG